MIYNIVPLAFFVWSFRMSAMYFALYAAKMTHIDNFSISILHQSHYWYTMRSWFFYYKNDHTPGEDHGEQYWVLGIHQKGDCAAEKCILRQCRYNVSMSGMEFLRMYYQYTVTSWKINVKMLIHINTNVIYNIVPFEVFVWLFSTFCLVI